MTLEETKTQALVTLHTIHSATLLAATGGASPEERDTWSTKEIAARAFMSGSQTTAQQEMLEAECYFSGSDPLTLCNVILAKGAQFQKLVGTLAGIRSKFSDQVNACSNVGDVDTTVAEYQIFINNVLTA